MLDNRKIISGNGDFSVNIWNVNTTGQKLNRSNDHTDFVNNVVFFSDNKKIVSSFDNNIIIWNANSGRKLNQLYHTDWIYNVAFSRNNQKIVSIDGDNSIIVWDVNTGQILNKLKSYVDLW